MNRSFEIPIRIVLFIEATVEADSREEAEKKVLTFEIAEQKAVVINDGGVGQWCEFDQTTKLGFGDD
tara:strand:+ start:664 stop:864 length:201 start_codon:yes stop_codon:yes gene_type:complete